MKFKQYHAENQRLDRITTTHLVIGIDIGKEKHVARAVNYRGIVLGKPCTFTNDHEGFKKLQNWANHLLEKSKFTSILAGMEPTGHYWLNLATYLSLHWELVLVNPTVVKRSKENRDNSPNKSDLKDALVIAEAVKNGHYSAVELRQGAYQELHVLMSHHEYVITQFVRVQNRIHRWLDLYFPEYRHVFKDWTCQTSLATLKLFPLPQDLKALTPDEVYDRWKPIMQRRGSKTFAYELVAHATNSVGQKACSQHARTELAFLLKEYRDCERELKTILEAATALLTTIPMAVHMLAIPGVGPKMTAQILAETGDLSRYDHGRQVLRRAGLHLAESSSGKHQGQVVITKRGSSALRRILYLTSISLVKNNAAFRALHQHNVKNKKMKRVRSIIKCCGKLARILVGMARAGDSSYDSTMVTPKTT